MKDLGGLSWVIFNEMELHHVLNRGIDGRKLFLDSRDYARFVHNLYEFNDTRPADNLHRLFDPGMKDLRGLSFRRAREKLVEIHGWCLMKNHYHLLISELAEGGLSRFMTKVNVGYAKYYNERYERHGHLFQGKTKKILIKNEPHLLYILHYLHLNPLDYFPGAIKWRERDKGGIANARGALKYLDGYRWSSYLDYCGKKNFPSLIHKGLFGSAFGNYQEVIRDYLKETEISSDINQVLE
ncbi:transposase [Patescibacteria group bacterium]|nr:transposase [Patescibacteria group bacterium]